MIATQPFGRTGHLSSRTIFGAFALGNLSQLEADRALELLFSYGINHIDTAPSYAESELRLGPWMAQHRNAFFLATKTGERTYAKAREELHRSLERLQVDQIDLLQMHNLADPQEWEVAMGPGGALEALIEAREQGLVRYLGVTGHGITIAAMHRRSLEQFDFDTVLLPYNYALMQNPNYAADFEALMQLCQERNVAVQTIKAIARGQWGVRERNTATWYEPLSEQEDIDRAVHWVLGRPNVFLNTAGDINLLPKVLDAANRFVARPSNEVMDAMHSELTVEPLFV